MEHFLSLLPGTAFAGLPIPTEIQCPLTDNKSGAAQPNTITVDDHTDEQPVDDEEQLREAEKTADEQAANDQDSSEGQDAESGESVLFHHRNKPRDSEGTARILIHCGHTGRRKTVLLAGTRVSNVIAEGYNRIAEQRQALEAQGKLIDRILQEDISFDSQSAAAKFLDGKSMSGNTAWLTVEGDVPLKEML